MKLGAAFLLVAIFSSALFAQKKQAPVPPLQTPRQALTEIITGGPKAITKHLTVEVQQLLAKGGSQSASAFAAFGSLQGQLGSDVQSFESGPLLLVVNQPREHSKLEVKIENDDLSGDEDTMDLSLHMVRENSDQEPEDWEAFFSRLSVNLKKQAGVWRLNKIGVGVEFPLGDPEFLQKTFLKEQKQTGTAVATASNVEPYTNKPEVHRSPEQLITLVAVAEYSFARQHPDAGFSCSLSDLAEATKSMGLDQVLSGPTDGYKVSLSGCQGHPAGSFQVVIEPISGNAGKAFCTDATRNIRIADDGRGSTCLAFGRMPAETANDHTSVDLIPQPHTDVVLTAPPQDKD
jgi:hypothetical protein